MEDNQHELITHQIFVQIIFITERVNDNHKGSGKTWYCQRAII